MSRTAAPAPRTRAVARHSVGRARTPRSMRRRRPPDPSRGPAAVRRSPGRARRRSRRRSCGRRRARWTRGLDASRVVSCRPRPGERQPLVAGRLADHGHQRRDAVSCGRWLRNATRRSCAAADGSVTGRAPSASDERRQPARARRPAPPARRREDPRPVRRTGRGGRRRTPTAPRRPAGARRRTAGAAAAPRAASTISRFVLPTSVTTAFGAHVSRQRPAAAARMSRDRGRQDDEVRLRRRSSGRGDATSMAWRTIAFSSTSLRSTPMTSADGQRLARRQRDRPADQAEADDRDVLEDRRRARRVRVGDGKQLRVESAVASSPRSAVPALRIVHWRALTFASPRPAAAGHGLDADAPADGRAR